MSQFHDAIIVGAGPAGASCAVWLDRLGLRPLLIEAGPRVGGLPNENPFRDDWIAVLPGATGQEVAANIARSVEAAGVPLRLAHTVRTVTRCDGGLRATLINANGDEDFVYGRSLVIASGVRARGLPGYPPGSRWPGVLVGPGSEIVAQDYAGLSVAVLGGGDNAFENFVYVRERGARNVRLHARSVRARQQWVSRVASRDMQVGAYTVDPVARSVNGECYDLILVFYGWEPQVAFADRLGLARDEHGHLRTDFATAQTSQPDVYAIGEVARRMHPCVVTSMADGVVAATAIQRKCERAPLCV